MSTTGLDFDHIDSSIRLQDDLYRHFNGAWLKSAEIPADRATDGAFIKLRDLSEKRVRAIIESASGSAEAQKISDVYASFMDADAIEAKGFSPIQADLDACDGIVTLSDFISTMAKLEIRGLGAIFGSFIYADQKDVNSNILYLAQGAISLPNESYYREDQYAEIRTAFLAHVEAMFALVGITNGAELAAKILALETSVASHHFDAVKDRDATLTYNKLTRAELLALMPAFDFDLYLQAGEIPSVVLDSVIVQQPPFFAGLSDILAHFDRDSWVAWLKWNIISGSAAYLSADLVNQNFSFYGKTLSGTPELRERWKRAVSLVEGSLGEAVGKVYVEQHFPAAAKAAMEKLVANLIEAYRVSINEIDWMSATTKAKALDKLGKFRPKIGYPDKWRDYSALQTDPHDLFGNIGQVTKFQRDHELSKIGKPVDRDEWHMTPQTVNAYYNPVMNEIVFPAAILQSPFFSLTADDAVNYGGIGAVIGHEIGHGFDDQGSKFDGDGALNNWWSDEDRAAFEIRSNALIEQYNTLVPEETPDITVNGALTVGENIGDLGGLAIAYKAYQISLEGKPSPVIDNFTGEQRLFFGWAQIWRTKVRPAEMRRRIATDPHSPGEFRCNTIVSNFTPFYEAFGVTEKDGLWLDEASRVQIW
ncbi:MAG: peptidase M13 [Actinobacteria bacterium]|nr:peptidase M13 [Actinomycetota bacterium]MTB29481.1 peptidase M13 [Actinomycetota bacterium]